MANNMVVDPVCGTRLDSASVQFTTDYEGMRYYFCCDQCKHRFDHDPEAYRQADLTATNTSE
jgi:P-type Cu+ transporter